MTRGRTQPLKKHVPGAYQKCVKRYSGAQRGRKADFKRAASWDGCWHAADLNQERWGRQGNAWQGKAGQNMQGEQSKQSKTNAGTFLRA